MKITLNLYSFQKEMEIPLSRYNEGVIDVILMAPLKILIGHDYDTIPKESFIQTVAFYRDTDGFWRPKLKQ